MIETAADVVARLRAGFEQAADPARAESMAAYMKGHAPFFGIAAPDRRTLQRVAWAGLAQRIDDHDLFAIIDVCWAEPEREFQYAALDLLGRHIGRCSPAALGNIERMISTKSWWDTVDDLCRNAAGALVHRFPELRPEMDRWLASGELWLVRSAILHQAAWRGDVDIDWLEAACLQNAANTDFFIRKAIGWALRSYAHQGPDEAARVRRFLAVHDAELSGLSKREALNRVRH